MVSSQHRNLPGNRWWRHTASASNQIFTVCALTLVFFFEYVNWSHSAAHEHTVQPRICVKVNLPSSSSPLFCVSPDNRKPIELAEYEFPPSLLLHIQTKPDPLFSINEVINKTSSGFIFRFSHRQRGARGGGEEDKEGQESRSSLERETRREHSGHMRGGSNAGCQH